MGIRTQIVLFFSLAVAIPALPQDSIRPAWVKPIPFESLDQGNVSYYRYGQEEFLGTDLLITDRFAWQRFWAAHTEGMDPPPPVPVVNFYTEMLIVAVLGFQTSCGGPSISVWKVQWDPTGRLYVLIEDNETPGPLDIITNPYHIVKLKRLPVRSVTFEHQSPRPTTTPRR